MSDLCASVHDDLKAYCDGELPFWRRNAVRRHLAGCAGCREEVHAMQMLHEGLRAGDSPETALAPALRERILTQVADVPPLPAPNRSYRMLQYGLVASLVVNCAFLFLLGRNGTETFSPPPPVPSVSRNAPANSHPPAASAPGTAGQPPPVSAITEPKRPSHPTGIMHAADQPPPPASSPAMRQAPRSAVTPPKVAQNAATAAVADHYGGVSSQDNISAAHSVEQAVKSVRGSAPSPVATEADNAAPSNARPLSKAVEPNPTPAIPLLRAGTSAKVAAPVLAPTATPAPAFAPSVPAPAPAPPPPAPPAARTMAPGPGFADRGFAGGGGFGGSTAASDVPRDKPVALAPWPVLSLPAGIVGRTSRAVEADWQIDEKGQASDIRFTPTGETALDALIQDAILGNHYLPALKNGRPVSSRLTYTFVINP